MSSESPSRPCLLYTSKQILRIQAGSGDWDATRDDVFSEEFLLQRPLLTAIRRTEPTVLLIDETDKADIEIEGLLLEVLSDFAVTVPELGTITATRTPFVLLTSNATRELSEALKRRCLFLHIDFPSADLERRILLSRVPELPERLAEELVRIIGVLRGMQLKKVPSIAAVSYTHLAAEPQRSAIVGSVRKGGAVRDRGSRPARRRCAQGDDVSDVRQRSPDYIERRRCGRTHNDAQQGRVPGGDHTDPPAQPRGRIRAGRGHRAGTRSRTPRRDHRA